MLLLDTERFVIKAFNEKLLPDFVQYRSQPEVARYQSWETYSLEDAKALLSHTNYQHFSSPNNIGQWFQLALVEHESNQLLGDLAVHFIDNEQVEIGFTVAPQYQQQGIAFTAINRLLTYLFVEQSKHRVIAITDTENSASISVLEKVGFRREAHFVEHVMFKGRWGSEYVYAMLAKEFNASAHSYSSE